MKSFLPLFSALLFFVACKKERAPESPRKNNEFHALLVFSADSSQRIDVTGMKAGMGCGWGNTFVEGLREDDAYISLQVYLGEFRCVSAPGTFSAELLCEYRTNLYTGAIYGNTPANPGSITFTTLNAEMIEGYFETVCVISATDSVIITGTFKGSPS